MRDIKRTFQVLTMVVTVIALTGQTVSADPVRYQSITHQLSAEIGDRVAAHSAVVVVTAGRGNTWPSKYVRNGPPYGHAYGHDKKLCRHQNLQHRSYRNTLHRHEKIYYGSGYGSRFYPRTAWQMNSCVQGRDGYFCFNLRD